MKHSQREVSFRPSVRKTRIMKYHVYFLVVLVTRVKHTDKLRFSPTLPGHVGEERKLSDVASRSPQGETFVVMEQLWIATSHFEFFPCFIYSFLGCASLNAS